MGTDADELLERYIEVFRQILELGWPLLRSVDPDGQSTPVTISELLCDWQQAQWEIVVEHNLIRAGHLRGFLAFYSGGAESESCRFSESAFTDAFEVCCLPKEGKSLTEIVGSTEVVFPERGYPFDRFVGLVPGYFDENPPFDGVLLCSSLSSPDSREWVFRRDQVRFVLRRSVPSRLACSTGDGAQPPEIG